MAGHSLQTFGLSDNGKPVRLVSDDTFALELAENPTTGFRWAIRECPPEIEVTADDFTPPDSRRPGAGGIRRWAFRAAQPGQGTLTVELRARGGRGGTPQTFTIAIDVQSR